MRYLALLSCAAAAVAALASCAGGERPPVAACDRGGEPSPGTASAPPPKPFLGMLRRPDTSVVLARLDPLSLAPVSRRVEVGEYHDAWSLSPDHSQIALGISAPGRRRRAGIMIVDLETMRFVRAVDTGVFAGAVAWLGPRRLVAGLGQAFVSQGQPPPGGTVLVDPETGEILRRWAALSDPQASARTPDGVVMLFPGPLPTALEGAAAARLAVVDRRGRLRSVALDRIRLRFRDGAQWDQAALAVDPARARAWVFAADAPAAEVDLRTMHVSYRRLEPLFVRPGEVEGDGALRWRHRRALWLGDERVLVVGRDDRGRVGAEELASIAAGATLVDTASWRACVLDAKAAGAAFVAGTVLVYGRGARSSPGLRAYTIDGRETFRLFDRENVWDVHAVGGLAYVSTAGATYLVDPRTGDVLREIAPSRDLVDVVPGASSHRRG